MADSYLGSPFQTLKAKYPSNIKSLDNPYSDENEVIKFKVSNVKFGSYAGHVRVSTDAKTNKVIQFSYIFPDNKDPYDNRDQMDNLFRSIVDPVLGEPSKVRRPGYGKDYDDIWVTKKYTLNTSACLDGADNLFCFVYADCKPNVRNVRWGASKDDVMKIEGMPNLSNNSDSYLFTSKVA